MSERAAIASAVAKKLRQFGEIVHDYSVMIGFDGFIDSIIRVVDQRSDPEHFLPIETIEQFGRKILNAAGHSGNFELVTVHRKQGGNGPIMANAMAKAGFMVTYVGCLGHPKIDPVFESFAKQAEVHSVAQPGTTEALEFSDGKLLLGKYERLLNFDEQAIYQVLDMKSYQKIIARSRLVGMANWTMLGGMSRIWRDLIDNILPNTTPFPNGQRQLLFVDLSDPQKRTRDDLAEALALLGKLNRWADVILGLNLNESLQVAEVLGVGVPVEPALRIETIATNIRAAMKIHCTVVHRRRVAAAALQGAGGVESAYFAGPFINRPKLSTGAGDNFNAGFCMGLLADLTLNQCLCAGTATSGYYVRHSSSPSLEELAEFCDVLPLPES